MKVYKPPIILPLNLASLMGILMVSGLMAGCQMILVYSISMQVHDWTPIIMAHRSGIDTRIIIFTRLISCEMMIMYPTITLLRANLPCTQATQISHQYYAGQRHLMDYILLTVNSLVVMAGSCRWASARVLPGYGRGVVPGYFPLNDSMRLG